MLAADTYKLHRHLHTDGSKPYAESSNSTARVDGTFSIQDTLGGSTLITDSSTTASNSFADLTQRSRSVTSVSDDSSGKL